MVYNQKFVVVVKVNGSILRENSGEIFIPFGSEYSIMLKNLNSVKAVAKMYVDGSDVLGGYEVIVPPNSVVELEGFSKNNKVTNKFKFIEKTQQITEYRGNKIDDGLVRVSFKFEELMPISTWYYPATYGNGQDVIGYRDFDCTNLKGPVYGASYDTSSFLASATCNNTEGITVKGSSSSQQFSLGSVGKLEDKEHVIVLKLKGFIKNKKIKNAVVVNTKITCDTCGKNNRTSNKFCFNCGTALF